MVVTASTGQTPFAKHVFPRFWFQKKKVARFNRSHYSVAGPVWKMEKFWRVLI